MNQEEMAAVLKEVETAIDKVQDWCQDPAAGSVPEEMHAFHAHVDGWRIHVVDFDITEQGFDKRDRGYDGAASHERGVVIRLTRELAEKAARRAREQLGYCRRCGGKLAYASAIYCGAGCSARDGA